jgi:hypothetical protein
MTRNRRQVAVIDVEAPYGYGLSQPAPRIHQDRKTLYHNLYLSKLDFIMIMLLTLPLYPSLLIVLTCDSNNPLACLNAIF